MSVGLFCLALAVFFEARGEPLIGQVAVAQTVLNRVAAVDWPDNTCDVVKQGPRHGSGAPKKGLCQFSFWCDSRPETIHDKQAWLVAIDAAIFALESDLDVSEGATHYHSVDVTPSWLEKVRPTVTIGRHHFYRAV